VNNNYYLTLDPVQRKKKKVR